jgi:hypothetical protein
MRIILYFALFLFATGFIQAQDTLYKSDGSRLSVKILERNDSQVRYKPSANPDGPVYVISTQDVQKIVYQDGTVKEFSLLPSPKQVIPNYPNREYKINNRETDFGQNFIAFTLTDLLFNSVTFSYEYTFESGDFSMRFPLSFGLTSLGLYDSDSSEYSEGDFYNRDKTFSLGFDFYFYPAGQGLVKFYFGPSVEYGQFNYWSYYYNQNTPYNYWYIKETGTYFAFLLQNGMLIQPSKKFNVSLNLGIGYSQKRFESSGHSYNSNSNRHEQIAIRGGISIGYKF